MWRWRVVVVVVAVVAAFAAAVAGVALNVAWMVDRPAELVQVVRALRRRRAGTVGITTTLHGAGGFGKTTLARLVRADKRVLRRFGGRVYWVTLGRDVRKEALVARVVGLLGELDSGRPVTATTVEQVSDRLAACSRAGLDGC